MTSTSLHHQQLGCLSVMKNITLHEGCIGPGCHLHGTHAVCGFDSVVWLVHSPSHPPAVEDSYIDFPSSPADDNNDSSQAAPDDVAPGDVAPGDVALGHVAPGHVAPDDVAPGHVAPGDEAVSDVAPRAGIRKAHLLAFLSEVPASEVSTALEKLGAYALSRMPFVLVIVVFSLNGRTNLYCFASKVFSLDFDCYHCCPL